MRFPDVDFVLAGFLVAVAVAAILIRRWLQQRPAPCLPQQYELAPRPGTFAVRALDPLPPVVREPPVLEAQSPAWRAAMEKIGQRLRRPG